MPPMNAEEWRDELEHQLAARQPSIELYSNYYDGNHRLAFAYSKFKEAFGDLFKAFATNWCSLVCDIPVERLGIQGFRFGQDEADDDAWRIWQVNNLDVRSIAGHTEAVKTGYSALLVGPPPKPGGEPRITVEHPSQVICAHDPADRRIRLAALKKFRDIDGAIVAQVFLPESITTFRRPGVPDSLRQVYGLTLPSSAGGWDAGTTEANPLGIVPLIPLENNPDLLTGGVSDLKPVIPLNDAANKFFTDMLHASEFTSFPQRVLTGVELPKDPITGEIVDHEQIRAAVSRLWAFEEPAARVTQLPAGSLTTYVEGIDLAVQHLAAVSRTPPHYLLAKLANVSGEALVAAETGLVARCRRKHIDFSDAWEDAMRLAFLWRSIDRAGSEGAGRDAERAEMTDAETIWVDPESRHPGQVGDSLVKKKQVGVPDEILWEEAGYTPKQIERMKKLRAEQREIDEERDAAANGLVDPRTGQAFAPGDADKTDATGGDKAVGDKAVVLPRSS